MPPKVRKQGRTVTVTRQIDVYMYPCGLSTCTAETDDVYSSGWTVINIDAVTSPPSGRSTVQQFFDTDDHFRQWIATEY